MNKVAVLACLIFSLVIQAQNKIAFTEIESNSYDFTSDFKSYKILEIHEQVNTIADGEPFTVQYDKEYPFTLKENKLLARNYIARIKDEKGVTDKNIFDLGFDGRYYQNSNATSDYQMAMSIFENQYTIFIKDKDREFYIEPLKKFNKNASVNYYIYYEVKEIIDTNQGGCLANEVTNQTTSNRNAVNPLQPNENCKTIEMNFCIDYTFYITYASVNEAINRTLEVLNLTQLDYSIARGLAYDVSFKVKQHYVITCSQCNYWPTTPDISLNFSSFTGYYYSQMFNIGADVRVFWQANLAPTELNGIATQPTNEFLDCSPLPTVAIREICLKNFISATGTNLTRCVLSHELGHNLSCPHEGSGNSNIMAFGFFPTSNNNVWHSNSIAIINNSLTVSNCYYDCMTEPCYNTRVQDVVLNINTTDNTFVLNWLSETDMEYKVRLFDYATNAWSEYTTLTYPANTVTFNYVPQVSCKYRIEITPVCSGTSGNSYILLFKILQVPSVSLAFQSTAQDEVLCSGLPYTFEVNATNPGSNAVYQWRIDGIVRGSGSTFTTSILQNNDILDCSITNTEYCAFSQYAIVSKVVTVIPQPCSLANEQFEKKDLEYYPNPVVDFLKLKSQRSIYSISLYNVLGQKVAEYPVQALEGMLDLSQYPKSTYFAKVAFEDGYEVVKILKE